MYNYCITIQNKDCNIIFFPTLYFFSWYEHVNYKYGSSYFWRGCWYIGCKDLSSYYLYFPFIFIYWLVFTFFRTKRNDVNVLLWCWCYIVYNYFVFIATEEWDMKNIIHSWYDIDIIRPFLPSITCL